MILIFNNSLPAFQEAFISYYGESERNDIEEKFKNALYIPYRDIDTQKLIIDDLEHKYFEMYLDGKAVNPTLYFLALILITVLFYKIIL